MAEQDSSYRLLFSHPEMVADLLRDFVREEWIAELDLTTLERVEGSYVSDDLRSREEDVVWKVRWGAGDLYIYLLIEFQSGVDRWMALRIMVYLGLLYQDLIRGNHLTPTGKLPPVLPIVLYNGDRPWTAATEVGDLVEGFGGRLAPYRPALRYLLISERDYDDTELASQRNLVAALFRLENSRDEATLLEVARNLVVWLHGPGQDSLRRAFTVWFRRYLFPDRFGPDEQPAIEELHEVPTMLAERLKEWQKKYEREGLEKGMRKGMQQGIQQGMQRGMQQGMQQGIQQGVVKGRRELLLRLLERRFGPLAPEVHQRLEAADEDTLLDYAERLLAATSLDEVFGGA